MQLQALIVEQKSRDGGLDLPHKGWGLQELLVVPGAANLIYCSCCRFGTGDGSSCVAKEDSVGRSTCATPSAVVSIPGRKFARCVLEWSELKVRKRL